MELLSDFCAFTILVHAVWFPESETQGKNGETELNRINQFNFRKNT